MSFMSTWVILEPFPVRAESGARASATTRKIITGGSIRDSLPLARRSPGA